MNDEHLLYHYESISELTRRMLAAARGSEWDALLQLEQECGQVFARVFSVEDGKPRNEAFQRRKAELIHQVLDDDARIRLLVEPWLQQLTQLIGHTGRERRLSQVYGAGE